MADRGGASFHHASEDRGAALLERFVDYRQEQPARDRNQRAEPRTASYSLGALAMRGECKQPDDQPTFAVTVETTRWRQAAAARGDYLPRPQARAGRRDRFSV